jgi:AraC family transcriptional regulator
MIRGHDLHTGPLVRVIRFDHPAGRTHRDPPEETASDHAASFVERGAFDVEAAGRVWAMGPGSLFVTHPGFTYRCRHAAASPDDVSLSVHFDPALLDDVRTTTGRGWNPGRPGRPITNRLAYLRARLEKAAGGSMSAMEVVPVAGELAAAIDGDEGASRLFRTAQLAWYARRVDLARELLASRLDEPLTLDLLAREAGMSPFHFSRVFRELTGVPPHRYLLRLRLDRAARRLREGGGVTDTCFASGFNNLSHFIRSFRKAYGVSPSRYAAGRASGRNEQESASGA